MLRRPTSNRKPAAFAPSPVATIKLRLLRYGLWGTGFLALAAAIAGWIWPSGRLWGVHHAAFLPIEVAFPLLGVAALLLTPAGSRLIAWILARCARAANSPAWRAALLALLLFLGLRSALPLLGDGELWINELAWIGEFGSRGKETPAGRFLARKEPLELGLHEIAFRAVALYNPHRRMFVQPAQEVELRQRRKEWYRNAAQWTYAGLSALAGALFVFAAIRFARRSIAPPNRLLFFLTLFSGGGILLFFGYVENYTWASLLSLLFLQSAVTDSVRPRFPWRSLLMLALAVGFHFAALILLPAWFYLLYQDTTARSSRWQAIDSARRARWFVAVYGLILAAAYTGARAWTGRSSILPLLASDARDGYALLSWPHGADLLSLIALAALIPLGILLFTCRTNAASYPAHVPLGIAAVTGGLFVLLFDPNLGLPRDWDLLAFALWPLVFWGAWTLGTSQVEPVRVGLAASILAAAIATTAPFVAVNANAAASLRRFESLLQLDPARSGYGWENLALYYRRANRIESEIAAWQNAYAATANPRYELNAGDALRRADRLAEAEPLYRRAVEQRPDFVNQLFYLSASFYRAGEPRKAKDIVQWMTEIDPENPRWRQLLRDIEQRTLTSADTLTPP